MQGVLIGLVTLCASYIQSVTGFGFGIFAMMFLPSLMLYTEANVLSSTLSLFTSLSIAWLMRRQIHWKNILFPLAGCLVATYAAVAFVLLMACCLFIPKDVVKPSAAAESKLPARKLWLYAALAVIALLSLAKIIPAWALAVVVAELSVRLAVALLTPLS